MTYCYYSSNLGAVNIKKRDNMKLKTLYAEIREDLFDFLSDEVEKRKKDGERGISKAGLVEEIIQSYKNKIEKSFK